MKKLLSVLTLSAVMMLPMGLSANVNETTPEVHEYEICVEPFSCTITDGDFKVTGPCRQVRKIYAQYLAAK